MKPCFHIEFLFPYQNISPKTFPYGLRCFFLNKRGRETSENPTVVLCPTLAATVFSKRTIVGCLYTIRKIYESDFHNRFFDFRLWSLFLIFLRYMHYSALETECQYKMASRAIYWRVKQNNRRICAIFSRFVQFLRIERSLSQKFPDVACVICWNFRVGSWFPNYASFSFQLFLFSLRF